jgi:hypothetical protein
VNIKYNQQSDLLAKRKIAKHRIQMLGGAIFLKEADRVKLVTVTQPQYGIFFQNKSEELLI